MAVDRCMIDTNVLVYSTVAGNPWHEESRRWLSGLISEGVQLCASPQILREYLVVLTRGEVFAQTFTPKEALDVVSTLRSSLDILIETKVAFEQLRRLVRRHEVSGAPVHDANVVATMQAHGVSRLATYNQNDFQRYDEIVLEPLPETRT